MSASAAPNPATRTGPRWRRALHYSAWVLLVLPLVLLAILLGLLVTPAGVQLAAAITTRLLPAVSITDPGGSLANGLRAGGVTWQGESVTVHLEGLATVWNPRCLWKAEFCIASVAAGALHITINPSAADAPSSDDEMLDLPLLVLPWDLQLHQLFLGEILVITPDRTTRIGPVSLRGEWSGSRIRVADLHAAIDDAEFGRADAWLAGTLETRSEWPISFTLAGTYVPPLEDWQEQSLRLNGEGNLRHLLLDMQATATARVPQLPPLELAAEGRYLWLDLEARLLDLVGSYGGAALHGSGDVRLSRDGVLQLDNILARWGGNQARLGGRMDDNWDITGTLTLAEPTLVAPDAHGRLDGSVHLTGPLKDPLLRLNLASEELALPQLQLQQLAVEASLAPVTLDQIHLQATAKSLGVGEVLLQNLNLALDGNAARHQLELQGDSRDHRIDLAAQGTLDPASYDWNGTVSRLALQLNHSWQLALQQPARLRWQQARQRLQLDHSCFASDDQAQICVSLDQQIPQNLSDVRLDITAFDLARLQPWLADTIVLTGRLDTRLHLQGHWQDPQLTGTLALDGLGLGDPDTGESWLDTANVQAEFGGRQATVATDLTLPDRLRLTGQSPARISWGKGLVGLERACWQGSRLPETGGDQAGVPIGSLCLQLDREASGGLQLNASADLQLSPLLQPWMPPGMGVNGSLDIQADGTLRGGKLQASLKATVEDGSVLLERVDAPPLELPFERLQLLADLQNDLLDTRLELTSADLGNGSAEGRITLRQADPAIDLVARLDAFNVGLLRPLFPQLGVLTGTASARLKVNGALAAPQINGHLALHKVALQSARLPVGVDDLTARLELTGDQGVITGTAMSGKGKADISGQLARLDTGWTADIRLQGRNIPVRDPPDINLLIQPDISIQLSPERILLGGSLAVSEGFLALKPLPEGAISTSPDAVFVDESGRETGVNAGPELGVDIVVRVHELVKIRGFGGEVRLNGEVRVRQDATGIATGRGTIDIVEGSYTGYGQQLTIRKGQIIFNGPLEHPYINIEAVRKVESVVAGLRLIGPAREPIVTLFSEPSMPDSQVLYYIITGKPPGTGTTDDNTLVQNALLSLSLSGGQPIARNVASKVGIDDLQMAATGSGDTTEVQVSGYLSPRTYLQYGISVFQPVNTLTVRYRLRDNLFLEAVSGIASALDVLYTFEF